MKITTTISNVLFWVVLSLPLVFVSISGRDDRVAPCAFVVYTLIITIGAEAMKFCIGSRTIDELYEGVWKHVAWSFRNAPNSGSIAIPIIWCVWYSIRPISLLVLLIGIILNVVLRRWLDRWQPLNMP